MIIIHWDFTDGTEISYIEGKKKHDNFTTHCLDFFSMDINVEDIRVVRKDGKFISRKTIELHTQKEIRREHNSRKMLVAGSFTWLKY